MSQIAGEQTLLRVQRAVAAELLALPGVTGVGLGAKRVGGQPTGAAAIKVLVSEKLPAAQVPPGELIPPWIDGVPTDVELLGEPIPLTGQCAIDPKDVNGAPDGREAVDKGVTERPLVGGLKLTAEGQDPGSIGCLMWDPNNHDVGYILTCQHLFGFTDPRQMTALKGKLKIGQADFTDGTCHHELVGTWLDGDLQPGQDESVVKLFPGMTFKAEILGIGPVRGARDVTPTERNSGTCKVMKRGHATGLTGGTILADNVIVGKGLHSHQNLLLIEPNGKGGEGPGERLTFANRGDSGSAILNNECKVVGVLFARDQFGNGLARPIGGVLSRLRALPGMPPIEVAAETTPTAPEHRVPGGSTVAVPREVAAQMAGDPVMSRAFLGTGGRAPVAAPWFSDVPLRPGRAGRLGADLERSATGRMLVALWQRHGAELTGLLHQDRRLMLVWQREGGAALVQLLLRLLAHPGNPLPVTLRGEPLMSCLHKAYAELRRCGSPDLRADLERVHAVLPDLAGLDYQGILDALAAAPAEERVSAHE